MEKNLTEAEDLEPLFDYSRVQPLKFTDLDDVESSPVSFKKRRKKFEAPVEKKFKVDVKEIEVVNCDDDEEDDWLPPPPKVVVENQLGEDSTIKELRLKKQELASFTKAAEDVLRDVEESVKRKLGGSLEASLDGVADQPSKPPCERAKIVISIQDKEGPKLFRVFMVQVYAECSSYVIG
ncbi:uncharacterized protein LOC123216948 isoform X2 [Mangifera indica]|uniref:uncharacterized protein LOC123216948 isoform X2 n=1 Tax=Mangifera indica TaxID=29780 RepID=UPI001CFA0B01|nr:uncharacterized protein LOC123216948 isoform X2 [Mangifera indica]